MLGLFMIESDKKQNKFKKDKTKQNTKKQNKNKM